MLQTRTIILIAQPFSEIVNKNFELHNSVFQKYFKLQSQGYKVKNMVPRERSCTRNTHMKYESPIITSLNVKAKVKVFQK